MEESKRLVVPIYINEKIVLDMLAILEDGFSTVSQISVSESLQHDNSKTAKANIGTTSTLLSKLLKIDIAGDVSISDDRKSDKNVVKEKVHTNVSLFSKFREYLFAGEIIKTDVDIKDMATGDFVEIEGELQKNPLINYMDIFKNVFNLADAFTDIPPVGNRTKAKSQRQKDQQIIKQIEALTRDLKHSGTIDFIMTGSRSTAVLSVQEQYLANDNISEIIGGRFKALGKVIAVYQDKSQHIDLLRKTTLSIFPENTLEELLSSVNNTESKYQINLPEFKTQIEGPAVIIIPIAIYA